MKLDLLSMANKLKVRDAVHFTNYEGILMEALYRGCTRQPTAFLSKNWILAHLQAGVVHNFSKCN